jgi:hypothetical protein
MTQRERSQEAAKCFVRAAESLFAHPVDVGLAAVWASMGMMHLSHVPGVERGAELAAKWAKR